MDALAENVGGVKNLKIDVSGIPGALEASPALLDIADSIMEVPGVNSEVIFLGWNLGLWRV